MARSTKVSARGSGSSVPTNEDTTANGSDSSPRRNQGTSLIVERLVELEAREEKLAPALGTDLSKRVLADLKLTEIPSPLTFDNTQVIKEPYFLLLYAEECALKSLDLRPQHGVPAPIFQGISLNLRKTYTSARHPINSWYESMIMNLSRQLTVLLQTYCLIAPSDEAGRALPLEPSMVEQLMMNTKETRDLARDIIKKLDEDFTCKNAGRAAGAVLSGARHLDVTQAEVEQRSGYATTLPSMSDVDGDEGSPVRGK
jgi:hypothetical protein